jgi:hypothetical protein
LWKILLVIKRMEDSVEDVVKRFGLCGGMGLVGAGNGVEVSKYQKKSSFRTYKIFSCKK